MSSRYYRGLPRYYREGSAWYFRTQRGSNFLLPPGERYYGLGAVLPPGRYYRNDVRYYRVRSARYYRTQHGSNFLLPPGGAVL